MRITGLSTGLDTDEIIKTTMQAYRTKIDTVTQKKDTVKIKQDLYREVIKDFREFYNKYLDITNKNSLLSSSNINSVKFSSSNENIATARDVSAARAESYTVDVKKMATSAQTTLKLDDFKGKDYIEIEYGGVKKGISIAGLTSEKEIAQKINSAFSSSGINAKYSDFEKGIIIETSKTGTDSENPNQFKISVGNLVDGKLDETTAITKVSSEGSNAEVVITDSQGRKIEYIGENSLKSNSFVVDGMEVSFFSVGEATITGKKDVTELMNNITNFVKDYNELVVKLNKLTTEKRDKDYQPLTADQKKEMSESEIELWNEKVKEGQLKGDMYLTSLSKNLRSAMTTFVEGAGINLESIGISVVKDYKDNAGTFTIDESKLKNALENDFDRVKALLIDSPDLSDSSLTENDKFNKKGVFVRLKETIYDTMFSSKSTFIKKVGYVGSSTYINNDMTKEMDRYTTKIAEMEKQFTTKETNLYIRYASLESAMAKYNSQQSYLSSMLGG